MENKTSCTKRITFSARNINHVSVFNWRREKKIPQLLFARMAKLPVQDLIQYEGGKIQLPSAVKSTLARLMNDNYLARYLKILSKLPEGGEDHYFFCEIFKSHHPINLCIKRKENKVNEECNLCSQFDKLIRGIKNEKIQITPMKEYFEGRIRNE